MLQRKPSRARVSLIIFSLEIICELMLGQIGRRTVVVIFVVKLKVQNRAIGSILNNIINIPLKVLLNNEPAVKIITMSKFVSLYVVWPISL